MASVAQSAGASSEQVAAVQEVLARELGPDLDEAILEVAALAGGWRGRRRVRRLLQRTPRSDEEVSEDLRRLVEALRRVLDTTQQGQ
ncbi:MAG TPA: hypothetical protein VIV56_11820 [Gemmatimonadales bacterium]